MNTTVIIPTYNESENITELKRRLPEGIDVLVVDDSPGNGTAEASKRVGFQVLHRNGKKGLSSAVIDGIKACSTDKIVVMDADLQHPPELIPRMIEELDTYDFVVATRVRAEGWSTTRKLVSFVANLLALPLVPKIKDRMGGFFGFRKEVVNPTTLNAIGYKIGLEIMVKGHYNSVAQIPYNFGLRSKGESKLTSTVMLEYLRQLIPLYLYKFRMLRFMIVGASGTVVNLASLYLIEHFVLRGTFESQWGAVAADRSYLVAFIPAFLLSVVNNYVLNNVYTFRERTAGRVGFPKYLLVASVTLPLDLAILFALTEWCGMWYIVSAAIAIITVFIIRYTTAKNWIWRSK